MRKKNEKHISTEGGYLFVKWAIMWYCFGVFYACQEPVRGCLDSRATNFDVTASEECTNNCCQYPRLILRADYVVGSTSFRQDSRFRLGDDTVNLIAVQFYVSDVHLFKNNDKTPYRPTDSLTLFQANDTIRVLNNVALLGRNNGFDFDLGSFRESGQFVEIRFKAGLNDTLNTTAATKMPPAHPLSIKADSMYFTTTKNYIFTKIIYTTKSKNYTDTTRLFITTPKDVRIVKNVSIKEGFNAIIPLTINYLTLFNNVDLSRPPNEIIARIVNNYAAAFQ